MHKSCFESKFSRKQLLVLREVALAGFFLKERSKNVCIDRLCRMYPFVVKNRVVITAKNHVVITAAGIAPFLLTSVSQSRCVSSFSLLPLTQPLNLINLSFKNGV